MTKIKFFLLTLLQVLLYGIVGAQDFAPIRSRNPKAPDIDYGDIHPWEQKTHLGKRRAQAKEDNEHFFRPIRILFDIASVEEFDIDNDNDPDFLKERIDTLVDVILPQARDFWKTTIRVIPVRGPLVVGADPHEKRGEEGGFSNCPVLNDLDLDNPHFHSTVGVPMADLVIYVDLGGPKCSESQATLLPHGLVCELDQHDRPIAGTLSFCLENLQVNRFGKVPESQIIQAKHMIVHELGHILGVHVELFKFFRDSFGNPLTPRPFNQTEEECVDGERRTVIKPSCSTLRMHKEITGLTYYEVVTPTVRQVVRNHFDCQVLRGARLENQPKSKMNCFGTNWDQRLFLMEAMSSPALATDFYLSPLTLALLEDSGWYHVNYTSHHVKINPFGHGAGCDFVVKPCLLERGLTVPRYSKNYFCNDPLKLNNLGAIEGRYGCDAPAQSKTWCDLVDYGEPYFSQFNEPPPQIFQYFENPNLGSFNRRTDYCPVALKTKSIDCSDASRKPIFVHPNEFYGEGSKCFNGPANDESLCLASKCNIETNVLEVYVGNETLICDRFEKEYQLPGGGSFLCPKLKAACPEFFCPLNCAGRGVCKMTTYNSQCVCFNPSDNSTNCLNSSGLGFGGACYNPSSSPPLWKFSYVFTFASMMLMFIL